MEPQTISNSANASVFTSKGRNVYSVTDITRQIKLNLEAKFGHVWIEGEVTDFKHHTSGHMYFRLKDAQAVIDAVMFRGANKMLRFKPKDGTQVVAFGRVSVYEKRGQYQIYVERMEPKGVGALQLALEELKAKLKKEGLFDDDRKKPIPHLPRRIGVVTSPTGAAIRDILNIMNRRFSNVHILLHPVLVQGPGAAAEIAEAIGTMNKRGDTEVLIVGRGGGSLEDLWAFNEEIVARAIAGSRIPVISAVGHEIDFTVADFVADLRAPTPSAAAELVIPEKSELERDVRSLKQRLENTVRGQWLLAKERLDQITSRYAFKQPRAYVEQMQQRLDDHLKQIAQHMHFRAERAGRDFKEKLVKLGALNPLAILERGYSVTLGPAGKPLTRASSVRPNDTITTRLHKGRVHSKVTKVEEDES